MLTLDRLYTPQAVDDFINNQICRDMPNLRAQVEANPPTEDERKANIKVDAVCNALKRREQLVEEIRTGRRCQNGEVNVRV